jgi:two-component system cell cycle sensor histidine kinase/response regulator CckA
MDSGKAMAATVVHADDGLQYVLVVDDEPVVRRFAARALIENGFGVREADDGAMALELIRSGEVRPSVVLCDIVMPRMNGVQLLESLTLSRPELPIILMSGYGAAELAERGIASPCAVLAKPFTAQVLVAEVRRCIRVR